MATTVSNVANLTGGINAGNFIETDVDEQLFRFNSDDTPLMNLMLRAKRVKVNSPEVDHYMIDEPAATFKTSSSLSMSYAQQSILPLDANDQNLARPFTTLLVNGVEGYTDNGVTRTPGRWLMLFVTGQDASTNNPVVRAVNGPKKNPSDEFCGVPSIPAGTTVTILANSLYETQKEVDPDLIVPQPTRVYLQKRGMNQVVSDYFESQRKRLPFSKAVIAEQAIANFKVRGNRTLWAGRPGKMKINVPKMGMQYVYTTEGLRWQFKRELAHSGKWTVERLIRLAKMFFTGEDVPKTALLLAGKTLLEQLQCIDYSKHPEIQISQRQNTLGWSVTCIHTVFGDIEIKREPTLDRLGWENCGALIGEDRIVHYVYSTEHSFSDRVDGEEATRNGILIWDAIALKGSCHIWIEGDGNAVAENAFYMWDSEEAPEDADPNTRFLLICDCPGMSPDAKAGQMWTVTKTLSGSGADQKQIDQWSRVDD
ncbi:MAG: hypothetical protein K2M31_05115 [Muribaculaceae bacterium]|nr:hypothetical protein [Muribaculaceae bacterium]